MLLCPSSNMVTQITDLPWSKASHPAMLHFMCRKTAVGVSTLERGTDRRERRLNVCLVGSIDIFPCVQEKTSGREGGGWGVCKFMCVCLVCMVIRWLLKKNHVISYRRQSWGKDRCVSVRVCIGSPVVDTCARVCLINGRCDCVFLPEDLPAYYTHYYTYTVHIMLRLIGKVTWLLGNKDFVLCSFL